MNIAIISGGTSSERDVSLDSGKNLQKILNIPNTYFFDYPIDLSRFEILSKSIDVVIPMIHGAGGEDGEIQSMLEQMSIPYIFSEPHIHKQCLNKSTAKYIVSEAGVKIPQELSIREDITTECFIKHVTVGLLSIPPLHIIPMIFKR